jgi:hypothetical protein
MKTFEGYLAYIEDELGITLLDWQKEFLQAVYECRPLYYYPSRGMGRDTVMRALKILETIELDESLKKSIKKEIRYEAQRKA